MHKNFITNLIIANILILPTALFGSDDPGYESDDYKLAASKLEPNRIIRIDTPTFTSYYQLATQCYVVFYKETGKYVTPKNPSLPYNPEGKFREIEAFYASREAAK